MPAFIQEAACAERVVVLKVRVPGRTSLIDHRRKEGCGPPRSLPRFDARFGAGNCPLACSASAPAKMRSKAPMRLRLRIKRRSSISAVTLASSVPSATGAVIVTDGSPPRRRRIRLDELDDTRRNELEARGTAIAEAVAKGALDLHRADMLVRLLERARAKDRAPMRARRSGAISTRSAKRTRSRRRRSGSSRRRPARRSGATKPDRGRDWSTARSGADGDPARPFEEREGPSRGDVQAREAPPARRARVAEERLAQTEAQVVAHRRGRDRASRTRLLRCPRIDACARKTRRRAAPRDVALARAIAAQGLSARRRRRPRSDVPLPRVLLRGADAASGRKKAPPTTTTLTLACRARRTICGSTQKTAPARM